MQFRKWDVYIAQVEFEDVIGSKARPVVIIGKEDNCIILCLKMTGQNPRRGEYSLAKWKEAGLHRPTVVRIRKKLKLSNADIIKRIGRLDPIDIQGIELLLHSLI